MKPTRQLKVANYKSTIKILDATNAQVAHLENWGNARDTAERLVECWNECRNFENPADMIRDLLTLAKSVSGWKGKIGDNHVELADRILRRAGSQT